VSIDEQHVALPKLYGAPAYARPAPIVAVSPRPFDPDDLPIAAFQTEDERELASGLPAHSWSMNGHRDGRDGGADGDDKGSSGGHRLRPRPLHLRSIAGRLIGGD
jgi:hypothetical protein